MRRRCHQGSSKVLSRCSNPNPNPNPSPDPDPDPDPNPDPNPNPNPTLTLTPILTLALNLTLTLTPTPNLIEGSIEMPDGSIAGVVAGPGGGYVLNKARTTKK